ncbi:MAG: DUF1847 domain-containing protein [Ignavibacteriaceae bacterium]|jgi:uncharacterized metal-binding protein
MNCTGCKIKKCRITESCGLEKFDTNNIVQIYEEEENQKIVQAASYLVDDGKAGTLARLQELVEFIQKMNYQKVGLAYCFGMEKDAIEVKKYFKQNDISISTVSCTVGGIPQDNVNKESCIHKVSCNPIGQAEQLNNESADFVLLMGICLGHDILLQRNLKADFTTLVVKDRVNNNNPLLALRN